ncbi:cytochrome P450 [Lentzea sp. CA-135723]|uniref:cytochrome P450 n=1 Tax=Lentzea sp. CA-135723 TaxID=3239950 RepID=UPI003D8F6BBB
MAISSRLDTTRVLATVVLPTLAKSRFRGPGALAVAEKLQSDTRAIDAMRRLRDRYGPEPVRLRVTGRSIAVLVDPTDVGRLLAATPEPFAPLTGSPHGDQVPLPENVKTEAIVRDEADLLTRHAMSTGELTWDAFAQTWGRVARRIFCGDDARNDDRGTPSGFDAAGVLTMRALAIGARGVNGVLESARLWPTTPLLLRRSTIATRWHGMALPEDTEFVVYTPFFHRDPDRLPFADRYAPELWDGPRDPAIVPFGAGEGECPGRDLALAAASTMLDALSEHLSFPALTEPLPGTLNHYGLSLPATPTGTRVS